jgi:hypothetical protein
VSRPVAGRAGGRVVGRTVVQERCHGRRRAAVTRALALAGGLLLPFLPAAAAVGPGASAAPASASSAPSGNASSDGERPVSIDLTRFEPRVVDPTSEITLTVRLTNTGDAPVTHLALRLQRGAGFTTRSELVAADRDPEPDTTVAAAFQDVSFQLEPGVPRTFTYKVPAAELRLDRAGVYPVLLNVNGMVQGTTRRVGQVRSYVVEPPTEAMAHTTVAWLWPLTGRSHRDAAGHFLDDDLARDIRSGGRLDRVLATLEKLPRSTQPGTVQAAPAVPVTLAVDPALVEELEVMAAGPYAVKDSDGSGTQDALAFLQRLKSLAAVVPVVALPYGDVDADALQAAGLADVVTRSLPGTAAGTAHDDRGTGHQVSPSAGGQDGAATGVGAQILTEALGVRPRTDLAWLPSGPVRTETLDTLRHGGVGEVVLPAGALAGGDAALGLGRPIADAHGAVALAGGDLPTLVGDSGLGDLADGRTADGGPRVAEQRYLAELTLLSMQAPATAVPGPTVLVTPPRDVDPDPAGVASMMADTAQLPWLQAGSVDSVDAVPATPPGALTGPAVTSGLDAAGLAQVSAAVSVRDGLAGAAVRDAAAALAPYDAAIARASSLEWRNATARFRLTARDVRTALGRLGDGVTLVAPADGTYSLASNDAPLILTVRNDLPFAVQVLLQLRTTSVGLQLGDIGRQTLVPGQRTTLQVPTQVRHLGGFTVTAALTTPSGRALGDPVQIRVKSTAYGPIGLFITIGAAGLLGLLFLRRLILFVLRRRRGERPDDGLPGPAPEGASVPLPPTRSPV